MAKPLESYAPPHEQGKFGAVRRFDVHTGVDLYCSPGDPVSSIEDGQVVAVRKFTGPDAGSPWWNETWAVCVQGESGVIVYGEIEPLVKEGDALKEGQRLGLVKTVLKKDKGLPMTMLHLELYSTLMEHPEWPLGQPKPNGLLDPTHLLGKKQ